MLIEGKKTTDGTVGALAMDADNKLLISGVTSRGEMAGESVSSVNAVKVIPLAVDTSFPMLPANPNRRKLMIRNELGAALYVAFGADAAWGTASMEIKNYETRELAGPVWLGAVHGLQGGSSVTGFAIITEFTD